ncbi:hypothetical protein [Gemmatimonas sp.]|uniref:hypothetical protein n=1 Tax=Gemmatimonas sp. TaxID=1962908 RepID=UPI003982E185
MADLAFSDDPAKAVRMFAELLQRRRDMPADKFRQIIYLHAAAVGDIPASLAAYRDMTKARGGRDYFVGMVRLLVAAGEYSEALDSVAHWKTGLAEPARPFREEIVATVAQLRGDGTAMLRASRAMRRYPGWERHHLAVLLEIGGRVQTGTTAGLASRVDSLLASEPRGFRIDPVSVYASAGDLLQRHGHAALARTAWTRALVKLDSTAPRAALRGPAGADSVRLSRGRLLLSLGRKAEARDLLVTPALRTDRREMLRQGWLGVASVRLGDRAAAQRIERVLAADTVAALRSGRVMARAIIAEALGNPSRAASLVLAESTFVDRRTMPGSWLLRAAQSDARLVRWLSGH